MMENPSPKDKKRSARFTKYEGVFLSAPIGMFTATPEGRILDANPAMARMFGYESPREFVDIIDDIGAQLYAHPEDREKIMRFLKRHSEALNCECRYRRRDGSLFWGCNNVLAEKDSKGRITYYRGFVLDITASKLAEEELRKRDKRREAFFDAVPESVVLIDPAGTVLLSNVPGAGRLGRTVQEFVGTCLYDHFPPDVARFRKEQYEKVVGTGKPVCFHDTRSGRCFKQHCYPVFGADGKVSSVAIFACDITEHKRAEDALRESEKKHRFLMEQMTDTIWTLGLDMKPTYVSPSSTKVLGFTPEERLRQHLSEMVTPETYTRLMDIFAREMEAVRIGDFDPDRTVAVEMEYYHKDGRTLWLENKMRWLLDDAGNPVGIHGVSRDITDRKKAEEALSASQEKYASIFNHSMDAIFLTRPDGSILDANPAACKMLGMSVEEIRKRGREGVVDTADPRLSAALHQRKTTGRTHAEHLMIRSNGERFPVEATSSIFTTSNGEERTSMIIRDITERKRAEESLKRHDERLQNLHAVDRAILQGAGSPEAIAQTALQHLSRLLNCQCASAGIFSPGKDGMLIVASVINGAANPRIGTIIAEDVYGNLEILREGNAQIVENASGATASSPVCVFGEKARSFIKVPLLSNRGMIGVLLVGWNHPRAITSEEVEIAGEVASQIAIAFEHARLRRESECHAEELEQRVKERTAQLEAFSYSVSHDLRAPLRALSGYTQILMDEYSPVLDDEGKRVCDVIGDSARNMGALIDDLLAFSRISRAEISISSVDMAGMVESIFLESTTPEERERIDLQIGRLPPAQGDPVMLRHVWTNLLENAIKFSSKKKRAVIKVSARRRGAEAVYTVRDNGAGFDMQYAGKLFGVFQRLHSVKEFEGTGIGLAIVKRIIERHGGQVWAEGRVGKGATFHFTLYREE